MRIVAAIALVAALGGAEIERAQQLARSRDPERARFHSRYLFTPVNDTVVQIEVITEFRRLVLITEQHLLTGDQIFSRGLRQAEEALAPTRGILTLKAQLRFHPLNTYASVPAFKLALGPAVSPAAPLAAVATQVTAEYSTPYKVRGGRSVTTLIGASLQADIPSSRVGQTTRPVGVVLDGQEVGRTPVDFGRLD